MTEAESQVKGRARNEAQTSNPESINQESSDGSSEFSEKGHSPPQRRHYKHLSMGDHANYGEISPLLQDKNS